MFIMLEKLGQALKKAANKIAGAIFIDKKIIEGIVKELQRALISADVNVHLVKQITDEIKTLAADEKIKGVEKRDQLIKHLNDKIIEILGKEKKELVLNSKNQTKIMLLGLYGAGKCVHGNSKIQLSNGEISKIRKLYEDYSKNHQKEFLEDGELIELKENLMVSSFNPNTLKIENKKATHLWKLKKENLYEIKLDNGNDFSIKVTPEHPFFVLRNGKIEKVRADEIRDSDYIATPQEVQIKGNLQSLSADIRNLDLDIYLFPEEAKEILKGRIIKNISKNLKYNRNYCQLTGDLKKGIIPIEIFNKEFPGTIRVKKRESHKTISFPTLLTIELAEFLGYLIGDGHIGKNCIEIVNEDPEIIKRLILLSKLLFDLKPSIKKDFRTRAMYKIILASKTLVALLEIFSLKPGKKGKNLQIPKQIMLSDNETIRTFIKAYFDCDSSPAKDRRYIELCSESQILINQMAMLLKRFGIVSAISKKIIKNLPYWRLSIQARYAEKYANKIGYLIAHKQNRAKSYSQIGLNEGCGNQDMIPLGKILNHIRLKNGFSIGEIQANAIYSYGRYENTGFISREKLAKLVYYLKLKKKGVFLSLLEDIKNNSLQGKYSNSFLNGIAYQLKNWNIAENSNTLKLTQKGEVYLNQIKENNTEELLLLLENLATSNICWLPIKEINKIKNDEDYVYDLTVEDNHSFIAEGFIVHNTTTIAKLALYYSKRGKKTAAISLDVHRPAAQEQLKQICEKVKIPCFTDTQEKSAVKLWKKYLKQLEEYDLVLIDTAGRHSLDKELIDEIKILNKTIFPDYKILVIQADIGQAAKAQAEEFQKALEVNGVMITRMDSTAKAGGALTACYETKAPVFFIGTGEKSTDLEPFNPKSFVNRMLGLGDLESLLEKVQTAVDSEQQKKLKSNLEEGKFNLRDFQQQLESMGGLGSFGKLAEMIPGFSGLKEKLPENILGTQEQKMKKWGHIINSMTEEEIENPEIIQKQTTRIGRIAKGSGATTTEVRQLLKQYDMLKEFAKTGGEGMDMQSGMMSQKQMMKLAKKFGKKMRI